ncbi:acyl-CoA/acyl-ACP dehydrogenase [Phenylobacterium sp. LjRoot225]|uniref:acyl-CoA dehydrogenase family protein n=1 Tax=Phenylobacterium sp. LjRoot225 TaxID=3342285 RepID=UPI003ECFD877
MNFELNDDQRMIENLVERFTADRYQPGRRAAYRALPEGFSPENWKLLGEVGILPLLADGPEEVGGGPVETMVVMQALGRSLVVEPVLNEIVAAGAILAKAATPAQRERWLEPLLSGESHLGFAFAEHPARFSLERLETVVRSGRLTGRKTCVPHGAEAYVVSAVEDGVARLYLAPCDRDRMQTRALRLVDGSLACELEFDGAAVEPLGLSLDDIQPVLDRVRLAASAEMLGVIDFAFAATLDYVKVRRQFSATIGSFQAIQHRLADLYALKEQARSMLFRAALASPSELKPATAAAKAYVSRAALRITEEAIQLHGGMGISDELEVGAGLKRVLVLSSLFGDADHETSRYNALRAA